MTILSNLSIVVLTRNSEDSLQRTLDSIKSLGEIIIVDDYSIDETLNLAKKYTSRIHMRHLRSDFASQRNYALSLANSEWVLFLDDDETLSNELFSEIQQVVSQKFNNNFAYYIRRRDFWWGKELKYGDVYKARNQGLIRLVKRQAGHWHGKVHEVFVTSKPVAKLNYFINHYPHPDISSFISEINFYSSLRASELAKAGKSSNVYEIIFFPLLKFWFNYLVKFGFLDGAPGFVYAFMLSFYTFLVRSKLYLKQISP